MGKCIIFCAAGCNGLAQPLAEDDLVIAADGGLRHCESFHIQPDVILGDFDSLGYVPDGSRVFPVEKDDTDAMLAVRLGLEKGFRKFVIYGGLDGPRIDHTVANFQTLQFLADQGVTGYLVGKEHIVTVLRNGEVEFPAAFTGIFSAFCMGRDARGVTIRGMQYSLADGTLTAGFPLGVSNHFAGEAASVEVKDGSLLLIWDRVNGVL